MEYTIPIIIKKSNLFSYYTSTYFYNSHIQKRKDVVIFMIERNKERHKTLEIRDPAEFDSQLEKLLAEVEDMHPETYRFFDASVGHCAYIKWVEHIREPEDARDRAALQGNRYVCGECPFFQLQKDRRIKHTVCNNGIRTWYEKAACLDLYERIERGEIEIE